MRLGSHDCRIKYSYVFCQPKWSFSFTSFYLLIFQRASRQPCDFGILFGIDGVIVRGRKPLPFAKEAFRLLTDDGQFKVPALFVTNAGNSKRCRKAQQLSEWLDMEVRKQQIYVKISLPLEKETMFKL